jgi:hypothetical protein
MHKGWAKSTKGTRVLPAAVLLLLAACLSGADASKPVLPDKWPACVIQPVHDTLLPRLRQTHMRQRLADPAELHWSYVSSPLLTKLLPDTRWYLVGRDRGEFCRMARYAIAVRNDTSCLHWQLNHLLAAAGMLTDTSRRTDVTRIAVLFALLDESSIRLERLPTLRVPRSPWYFLPERFQVTATTRYALDPALDSASRMADSVNRYRSDDSTAVPRLQFRALTFNRGFLSSGDSGIARTTCIVDGRQRTFCLVSRGKALTRLYELDGPSIVYDSVPASIYSIRRYKD